MPLLHAVTSQLNKISNQTLKCFVEKALPLLPQVTEIITALKEQDFMTIMMIGMAMYEDIKEMIDVCIPKEQMLAANYSGFANCAGTIGGAVGVVAQLINAIRTGNMILILALIPKVLSTGGNIVNRCGHFLQ